MDVFLAMIQSVMQFSIEKSIRNSGFYCEKKFCNLKSKIKIYNSIFNLEI